MNHDQYMRSKYEWADGDLVVLARPTRSRRMLRGELLAEAAPYLLREQPRDAKGRFDFGTGGKDGSAGSGIDGSTVISDEDLTPSGGGNTHSAEEQKALIDRNAKDIAERWDASQEDKDALMAADAPGWFRETASQMSAEERNEAYVAGDLRHSLSGASAVTIAGAAAVADRLGIDYDLGEHIGGQVDYIRDRPALDRATSALGEAAYANTQDWLSERGIGSVDLYRQRGFYDDKAVVTSWAVSQGHTFNAPQHVGGRELRHEAIPAERIFSSAATGYGALEEGEFLVFNAGVGTRSLSWAVPHLREQDRTPDGRFTFDDDDDEGEGVGFVGEIDELNQNDDGSPKFSEAYIDRYGKVVDEYGPLTNDVSVVTTSKGSFHVADDSKGTQEREVLHEFKDAREGYELSQNIEQVMPEEPGAEPMFPTGFVDENSGIGTYPAGDGGLRIAWTDGKETMFNSDEAFQLSEGLYLLARGLDSKLRSSYGSVVLHPDPLVRERALEYLNGGLPRLRAFNLRFNPNHDEKGQFAEGDSSGGGDSYTKTYGKVLDESSAGADNEFVVAVTETGDMHLGYDEPGGEGGGTVDDREVFAELTPDNARSLADELEWASNYDLEDAAPPDDDGIVDSTAVEGLDDVEVWVHETGEVGVRNVNTDDPGIAGGMDMSADDAADLATSLRDMADFYEGQFGD